MRMELCCPPPLRSLVRRPAAFASSWLAVAGAALLVLSLAATLAAQAGARSPEEQQAYRRAMEQADQQIFTQVQQHSELMKNLEYVTTDIGPRLTGSPQMQAASQWTLQRFRDYGIDAHLETTTVPHAWYRGRDTAAVLSPIQRAIPLRSLGWSKATPGAVTGKVVVVTQATTPESLDLAQLKGAIVLLGKPATIPPDFPPPDNAYDAVIPPPQGVPRNQPNNYAQRRQMMTWGASAGTNLPRCRSPFSPTRITT